MAGRFGRMGIAGAGIGGLATAISVGQRCSHVREIVIYERAAAPQTRDTQARSRTQGRGAALLLWSNAVAVLRSLGLHEPVDLASAVLDSTEVHSKSGALLSTLDVGPWSEEAGAPTVVIRRPDLLDILEAHLPSNVVVEFGRPLGGFIERKDHVELRFEDGTSDHVDALIGADGLSSVVRRQVLGDEPARAAGYDAWVGITPHRPAAVEDGLAVATIGQGPRFWYAALRDGAVFWYATLPRGASERSTRDLAAVYRGWPAPIRELIESTPEADAIRTTIKDRIPSARWGDGRVTLLGDAAHPSTPDLGQGACQAIESAAVLGDCLATATNAAEVERALRQYEQRRMTRTAAISRLCWMTSYNSTIESPLLCGVRDLAIRVALASAARSSLRWILRGPLGRAPDDAEAAGHLDRSAKTAGEGSFA